MSKVAYGLATANLKSGSIGIKVRILPPHTILPDKLTLIDQAKMTIHVEEVKTSETEEENIEKEEEKVKTKKKTVKKKTIKKTKDEQAKNEDQE